MIRETQLEAWREINRSGLLKGRQLQVYNLVQEHCETGVTRNQGIDILCKGTKIKPSSIGGRFTELHQMGLIQVIGQRKDPDSGFDNDVFIITDALPAKKKKEPKKKRTAAALQLIEDYANNGGDKEKLREIWRAVKNI